MSHWSVRSVVFVPLIALAAGTVYMWQQEAPPPGNRTVTIGCRECPPFAGTNIAQPMSGFALDAVSEAARRLGIPVRFVQVDEAPRDSLGKGKVDIWPRLAEEPQDQGKLYFSEPWVAMNYCLLAKRGWRPRPGARVSAPIGRMQESLARQASPGAELVPLEGGKVLSEVCSGQLDAAFVESRVLAALLLNDRDAKCDGVQLETIAARGAAIPAGIAARPGWEWAAKMLRSEISKMAGDGTLASLHARWFLVTSVETGAFDRLSSAQRDLFSVRMLATGFGWLLLLMLVQTWRLRKLTKRAQRASGLKTRFVANVSHELRTPLSGIVGLVDMLSDTRMTAHQNELLRMVRSTADSLVQVINDLLDVAKVEAGQREIAHEPFELRASVDEVSAIMAGRATGKGIRLETEMGPDVPRRVLGDVTRLREILMNLLGNAIEHTERGEVRLSVATEQATPFQWHIAFTVSDTGAGISTADLARLFDVLERDDEADPGPVRRGGRLSIAIGKRLVDLLGGTMTVQSSGSVGASFRFVLPFDVASGSVTSEEPAPEAVPAPAETPSAKPLRILVCEDDPVNCKVAVHMLTKLAHSVEAVTNGSDAVEAAGRERFDLILMDCQLPDIDGFEVARRIRASGASAGVPVVALTAAALAEDRRRCVEAGMEGYLAKPLSLSALSETLDALGAPRSDGLDGVY